MSTEEVRPRPWLDSYAEGVPDDIELPTGSLVDLIESSVKRFGPAPALEFFGRVTTYRELGDQIDRAAEGLRRLGVEHGDRVALVLPNCPQHIVAFYAVLRLGAIVIEHNPLYTPRELRHQFEDHGATVVIAWDRVVETIQKMPDDVAFEHVVSVDLTQAMPLSKRLALRLPIAKARAARQSLHAKVRRTIDWRSLVEGPRIRTSRPRPGLHDVALLQYTSGTTGTPKGAILSHFNLHANALQGRAWLPGLVEGREVVYGVLPMFHAYGLTLCLTFAMSTGSRLVLLPRFDVDLVLDAAKKHPPTFLPAVPPIYRRLAEAAEQRGTDLSGIRFAISGAMNLPPETVELWERVTGGMLVEGYGLTETSPVALGNPVGPTRRAGTIGVPFPSTEAKVVDPDDPTSERPTGEAGELLLRGPQVFQGYWRKPDASREVLIDDGWFRTGDIVSIDVDGFVTVVDRIKELIITGGFNVSPSEVEDAVRQHRSVADVAVVGMPGEHGGEEVVAAVVLADGATLDEAAIRDFCREHLTAYKVPRRIVVVEELPTSLIGKVLRRKVRDDLMRAAG
ncbi:long-chain-fatty-acid--CoA ligase [Subtercola boreus]|uniref:Long-chain fatty acid--CoA ligase n=1 Tax=Subtercola boreus TaxID=120213 RepID=A0A3E0WAF0_9MICO|nr:long-chain-fatty-acid--CoA ligase [Subtercola boreus]RFA20962.1 long-chain fatty acid--CoA ligase [Subtercola boreus]RFA20992.1 long-chain fatty acid--CoA ligase [Subtercola boreus]RFA27156.1 long-chain fatty acid--CoA ligase [Subtercola boreus]